MSHLSLESLARVVDEAPTIEEAAHLESCETCRVELDALREDVQALSMLPDMTPSPDAWQAIERRLADEGLIRERSRFAPAVPRLAQMAAAVVLFLAGSMAGRMSAAPALLPIAQVDPAATTQSADPQTVPAADPAVGSYTADALRDDVQPAPDNAPPLPARTAPRTDSSVRLAANLPAALPTSMEDAAALLRQTEDLYLNALTRYAELATQSEQGDPVARLAALQSIVMTTNAALSQVPADPVINGVHLAALAQRDATFAQVAAVTGERWY
jgi:hypothetical protein